MIGADQEFLIAAAALNRRRDFANNCPAYFFYKIQHLGDGFLTFGGIADDPALAHRVAPCLKLGLDEGDEPGAWRGKTESSRKYQNEADEAHIGDNCLN